MKIKKCEHLLNLEIKVGEKYECEACIKTDSEWVHLRTCQTCGSTLCCDSSPNQHASKHHSETKHPVIISAEPGEEWMYCYVDDLFIE